MFCHLLLMSYSCDIFFLFFFLFFVLQMFAESKDEVCLVLFGTQETDNPLADGDCYENIVVARTLGIADFDLLQMVQNDITPSNVSADCILVNKVYIYTVSLNT